MDTTIQHCKVSNIGEDHHLEVYVFVAIFRIYTRYKHNLRVEISRNSHPIYER